MAGEGGWHNWVGDWVWYRGGGQRLVDVGRGRGPVGWDIFDMLLGAGHGGWGLGKVAGGRSWLVGKGG